MSTEKSCLFVPIRGNKTNCTNSVTTSWGFCDLHKSTSQSQKKKLEYKESLKQAPKKVELEIEDEEEEIVTLYPNKKGAWVEPSTKFVFDDVRKIVIGKEDEDGDTVELDAADKIVLQTRGWEYEDF